MAPRAGLVTTEWRDPDPDEVVRYQGDLRAKSQIFLGSSLLTIEAKHKRQEGL